MNIFKMWHKMELSIRDGIDVYFIDINIRKPVYNISEKDTFRIKSLPDKEFNINHSRIRNNACFYHSQITEPINFSMLEVGTDGNEIINYVVDSTDFYNKMNNKIMQMLLYVKEKNTLKLIFIVSSINVIATVYLIKLLIDLQTLINSTIGV